MVTRGEKNRETEQPHKKHIQYLYAFRFRHAGDGQISLQGSVAKKWNGKISTAFTAEAPHQEDVEASVAVVNATFVYCTAVRAKKTITSITATVVKRPAVGDVTRAPCAGCGILFVPSVSILTLFALLIVLLNQNNITIIPV